jgi:GTP-dependent phosphoenolpyruvate carboxykinase
MRRKKHRLRAETLERMSSSSGLQSGYGGNKKALRRCSTLHQWLAILAARKKGRLKQVLR